MAPYHLNADQHEGWHEEKQPAPPLPDDPEPGTLSARQIVLGAIAVVIVGAVLAAQAPAGGTTGGQHSSTVVSTLQDAVDWVVNAINSLGPKPLETDEPQATPKAPAPTARPAPTPAACICPALYKPVCGSDGVTYENTCFATCALVTVVSGQPCGVATPTPEASPRRYV